MNVAELKKTAEHKMQRSVEALVHDLAKIRTGRAHTGLLDQLAQLGAGDVDGTAFIQISQAADHNGQVVKDHHVCALPISQIPDLVDEMVGIHGPEVVVQEAAPGAEDTVKANPHLLLGGQGGIQVDGLVEFDANDALHGPFGGLLKGDVANTQALPQEVMGNLPADR